MKFVLVLCVVVGVLLVQANAVPEADAVDQAVGVQDVNAGGQNDAVESSNDALMRRKRQSCIQKADCANHQCPSGQVPYCSFYLCKCVTLVA